MRSVLLPHALSGDSVMESLRRMGGRGDKGLAWFFHGCARQQENGLVFFYAMRSGGCQARLFGANKHVKLELGIIPNWAIRAVDDRGCDFTFRNTGADFRAFICACAAILRFDRKSAADFS